MKKLLWAILSLSLLAVAIIQFIPAPPLAIPVQLQDAQRGEHRLLNFEGIANFRDLGGYPTADGRQVKWGVLYRSGTLAHSSRTDLNGLQQLNLDTLVDFRSAAEKEEEPDRYPDPPGFKVVAIPTLDDGNKMVAEIMTRIESGDFGDMDPDAMMVDANRQFASTFTPQYRQFLSTLQQAGGEPILWHCSAGKDRAGFASAIVLRILGVPENIVMQDYMASKTHALDARKTQLMLLRLFSGDEAADKMSVLMGVEEHWLQAAFDEIEVTWGGFDNYVRDGLQLSDEDVEKLRASLLTSPSPA